MATLAQCCNHERSQQDRRYSRVLWTVLGVNAAMFGIEFVAGLRAASVSLQADALDFLADATNYEISLSVVGAALRYRARATIALQGAWYVVRQATGELIEAQA